MGRRRSLRTRENVVNNSRKLTIIPLIFSVVFLITGTYAWFTYFSDVDVNLTGHVVSWKINFDDNANTTETTMVFNKIYPGMDDDDDAATKYNKFLSIENLGETSAKVTYYIKNLEILGETYTLGDYAETKVTADNFDDLKSDLYQKNGVDEYVGLGAGATFNAANTYYLLLDQNNIAAFLNAKYPFKFNFGFVNTANDTVSTAQNEVIIPKGGQTGNSTNFRANISWPYESYVKVGNSDIFNPSYDYYNSAGTTYTKVSVTAANFDTLKSTLYYANDVEDTYWGNKAGEYYKDQSGSYSAEDIISVKMTVVVHAEEYLGS